MDPNQPQSQIDMRYSPSLKVLNYGEPGGYTPEYGLGDNRYETEIEADALYDLDADPLNLAGRAADIARCTATCRSAAPSCARRSASLGFCG